MTLLSLTCCASDGDLGAVEAAIVNGTLVVNPEQTGQVNIPGCSATVLTSQWVLTARHCVDFSAGGGTDTLGIYDYTRVPVNTRAGGGTDTAFPPSALAFHGVRSRDAALIRLASPLSLNGSTSFRTPFRRGLPSSAIGETMTCFGWGFGTDGATWSGPGQLRVGTLTVTAIDPIGRYHMPRTAADQAIIIGDSGGGCFDSAGRLLGTHSTAQFNYDDPSCTTVGCGATMVASQDESFVRIGPWIDRIVDAPRPDDFNGDARSDLVWRDTSSGDVFTWELDARLYTSPVTLAATHHPIASAIDLQWNLVGGGDFDGDGHSDMLWRHAPTGRVSAWLMSGSTPVSYPGWAAGTGWTLQGTGDFNDDRRTDLLWVSSSTGHVAIWQMNGANTPVVANLSFSPGWSVAGVADFDKDGASDILWRYAATGELSIWRSNSVGGSLVTPTYLALGDPTYWASRPAARSLRAIGDFNGDGDPDLLWHTTATGAITVDFVRYPSVLETLELTASQDLGWVVASVGDYDMNGQDDLAWRHNGTGQVSIWLAAGFNVGAIDGPEEYSTALPFQFFYVTPTGPAGGIDDRITRTEF
jgi:hypothetical protein